MHAIDPCHVFREQITPDHLAGSANLAITPSLGRVGLITAISKLVNIGKEEYYERFFSNLKNSHCPTPSSNHRGQTVRLEACWKVKQSSNGKKRVWSLQSLVMVDDSIGEAVGDQ